MATKLSEFLKQHEGDLSAKVRYLLDQLRPLELELADVRRARAALAANEEEERLRLEQADTGFDVEEIDTFERYRSLSMKQLTLMALKEHFKLGATAQQLLNFFKDAYGRTDIMRSSLSPQLTRLKRELKIYRDGTLWKLAVQKKTPPDKEGVLHFTVEEESVERELFDKPQPQFPDRDPG